MLKFLVVLYYCISAGFVCGVVNDVDDMHFVLKLIMVILLSPLIAPVMFSIMVGTILYNKYHKLENKKGE